METTNLPRAAVIMPVYNDWDSFARLVKNLDDHLHAGQYDMNLDIIAVNDGSSWVELDLISQLTLHAAHSVEILHLAANMGHQRAIAIGLSEVASRDIYDIVIVMDADGEDRPEDVFVLLQAHEKYPSHIIVAERGRRTEGAIFKVFYQFYRLMFGLLVGITIGFGNFSLIPSSLLSRLTYNANLWNHLAATVIRSNIPYIPVKTIRGSRYAGRSKLGFEGLVIHGLSAISVYADRVFIRMLISLAAIACLGVIGIGIVVFVRFFTDLAIPGWATNTVGLLLVIVFQSIVFAMISVFTTLNRRSGIEMIPALNAVQFIREREILIDNE